MQVTRHFGVHYVIGSPLELVGFYDSDCVGNPNDRKTTSTYVFMLAQGPICFSRNKQHTISLSSTEVEYRGAMNAATQCLWLQVILRELGVSFDSPTVIWCDNKSAINISTDLV